MRLNCVVSPGLLVLLSVWESQWSRTEGRLWTGFYSNLIDTSCSGREVNRTSVVVPVEGLIMGRNEFGIRDTHVAINKMPCWFDPMLARIGQKFARKAITQLMISHFLSLFLLVTNPEIRRILYFTMRSDNPVKAWKRYTATILQVKLWYDEDIVYSKNFFPSLQRVKNIHRAMGTQLDESHPDLIHPIISQKSPSKDVFVPDSKMWNAIKMDLELSRKLVNPQFNSTLTTPSKHAYNQYVMSMTQFSFMALPILFPKQLLIQHTSSDLELHGFVHLWAGISYALGMNESYILCKDLDLTSCRTYTIAMLRQHFVPYLYQLDYETQVMLESLTWAVKFTVPPITMDFMILWLLEDILGIPCPNLRKFSSPYSRLLRYMSSVFWEPIFHWPGVQRIANFILRGEIQLSSLKNFGFDGSNSTVVADKGFYVGKK